MDVSLRVSVAIVRPPGGLLGFMKSWRGDHTVSLSGGVTVFRAWCGLLLFMKGGRVDHDVGLLGAVGGEMCRCGLCGVVLQDQSPGGECREIMTNGRWKVHRFPRLQATRGWEWCQRWRVVDGRQFPRLGCGDRRWADGVPNSQGRREPVGGEHWPS